MAKFCTTKAIAPCETPNVQAARVEVAAGDYIVSDTPEAPARTSYRKELFDDSVLFVKADLQKKIAPTLRSVPMMWQAAPVRASPPRTPKPVLSRVPILPKQERGTSGSDVVADILISMIGVGGLTTARAKKSV
jgi:hypothetical protein